jgi:uncharacterized membrane protein YesL
MQNNVVFGRLYIVCDWIMKLAYLNLLWLLFAVGGLIVFGMIPATVSLFTIVRKWLINKETDLPIFHTFYQNYKNEFLKSNKLGLILVIIGLFLYYDFKFIIASGGMLQYTLTVPLLLISLFYCITLLYIFPVYVHFDQKVFQYFKNSFYIGLINIDITILIILLIVLIGFFFSIVPGLLPFFCLSVPVVAIMWGAALSFRRIEKKQQKISTQKSF